MTTEVEFTATGILRLPGPQFACDRVTDDLPAIHAAIAALPADGGTVDIPRVSKISGPILIDKPNIELRFGHAGGLVYDDPTSNAVTIMAANCKITGGTITAPAMFDGANTAWSYAVIGTTAEADGLTVDGVRLVNVPRVGIGLRDCRDAKITGSHIQGNFPEAGFTGTETVHFGITWDPPPTGGNVVIIGNIIERCVQGVFLGNYIGATPEGAGVTITGNTFSHCWNHGVYSGNTATAVTVTGNNFTRCQIPVAATGAGHSITGNTMVTTRTGSPVDVTGVSLRDPVGCVVTGNAIRGDVADGSSAIALRAQGGTVMRDNVVSGNTVLITAGAGYAASIIGSGTTTDCSGNIITGNVARAPGKSSIGVLAISAGNPAAISDGNIITGNAITITGPSSGIWLRYLTAAVVSGNTVRLEHDAATPVTVGGVYLGDSSDCLVTGNIIRTSARWGAGVTLRGIWEAGAGTNSRFRANHWSAAPGKLAGAVFMLLRAGSDTD